MPLLINGNKLVAEVAPPVRADGPGVPHEGRAARRRLEGKMNGGGAEVALQPEHDHRADFMRAIDNRLRVLDEPVGAHALRAREETGHRHHFASHLPREPRGDERCREPLAATFAMRSAIVARSKRSRARGPDPSRIAPSRSALA